MSNKVVPVAALLALLCALAAFTGKEQIFVGGPHLTPAETVLAFYTAIGSADTARAYQLASAKHLAMIKQAPDMYFARTWASRYSIQILTTQMTSDTVAEVRYSIATRDRGNGNLLDSEIVESKVVKENGEWKFDNVHMDMQRDHDLNLSFERPGMNGVPFEWYAGGGGREVADRKGYAGVLDSVTRHEGKFSLHLKFLSGHGFGVGTNGISGDMLKQLLGKTIRYSGWIKTKNVSSYAGLWWRVDGENGKMLAFNNMYDSLVNGTRDWQRYSFELPVVNEAKNINFGVIMGGSGEAWFDGLSIDTNGVLWKK